ncbi:MAG: hypothetical protein IJ015_04240 [Ruminococcus sp.]|nr:hypothetical protein [Ruminococcus sp.]
MKKKFTKRLIATMLILCMTVTLIPLSTISSSAAVNLDTLDGWATSQLYSRGFAVASEIVSGIADATNNETVKGISSYIDKYVFGNGTTGDQLQNIQNTCNEILKSTKDTQHIVEDINKKISQQTINVSSKECNYAYMEQVTDYLTQHDESIYDFYNVYLAYTDYLEYAVSDEAQNNKDKVLEEENEYLAELGEFYAAATGDYWNSTCGVSERDYYEEKIYKTNTIDVCLSGVLNSLLNNMDPESYVIEKGYRFIDCAAQYAYYAYPFSSEQAQFVDHATEYQINAVTTVMMLYQDFISQRAEYFDKMMVDESTTLTYTNSWNSLIKYYDKAINKYTTSITNFLNSDIVLKDIGATTNIDMYLREESATNRFNSEMESYKLDNTNYKYSIKYNGNQVSQAVLTKPENESLSFYKNASVTVENGKLKFTPFYIMNGDIVDPKSMELHSFDINDKNSWGTFFGGLCDTHYLKTDYYNLANGRYSDGLNTYSPISDPNELKSIINETYYTANCSSPYSYFSDYLGYGAESSMYLLLDGKTEWYSKPEKTRYTLFPVMKISDNQSYSTTWNSEMMQENKIPSGSKFAVILTPTSDIIKSKVDTNLIGEGEISVSGLENGTAVAGEKVNVKITAPENYRISNITVQYHNDKNDTKEKVISTGIDCNEYTLDFSVPYSNVTIEVQTKEIPPALDTDENDNFLVSSYDDLCQMAAMVNSGYENYVYGSYILTNDITFSEEQLCTNPIGTVESPFKGNFDGQGHVISNLNLDPDSTHKNLGLFGTVISGKIHSVNLIMETYSVKEYHDCVGSICGYIERGEICDCIVISALCASAKNVGGITGTAKNSVIKNCSTELMIFTDRYTETGDICGVNDNSEIIDCTSNNVMYR